MIKYIVYMAGPRNSKKIAMQQSYIEQNKKMLIISGSIGVPLLGFILYKTFSGDKSKTDDNKENNTSVTLSPEEQKILDKKKKAITPKITEKYNSVKTEINALLAKTGSTELENVLFSKALEDIEVQKIELTDKLSNAKTLAEVNQLESDIDQITKTKTDLDQNINPESLKKPEHIKEQMNQVIKYVDNKLNKYNNLSEYFLMNESKQNLIKSSLDSIKKQKNNLETNLKNKQELNEITPLQKDMKILYDQVLQLEKNIKNEDDMKFLYDRELKKITDAENQIASYEKTFKSEYPKKIADCKKYVETIKENQTTLESNAKITEDILKNAKDTANKVTERLETLEKSIKEKEIEDLSKQISTISDKIQLMDNIANITNNTFDDKNQEKYNELKEKLSEEQQKLDLVKVDSTNKYKDSGDCKNSNASLNTLDTSANSLILLLANNTKSVINHMIKTLKDKNNNLKPKKACLTTTATTTTTKISDIDQIIQLMTSKAEDKKTDAPVAEQLKNAIKELNECSQKYKKTSIIINYYIALYQKLLSDIEPIKGSDTALKANLTPDKIFQLSNLIETLNMQIKNDMLSKQISSCDIIGSDVIVTMNNLFTKLKSGSIQLSGQQYTYNTINKMTINGVEYKYSAKDGKFTPELTK